MNAAWLITLPHAGGSSNVFKKWTKKLNINLLNVEYPGHWARMNEPLVGNFEELVEDVQELVIRKIKSGEKVYIFGHSVGAIIAWQIAPFLMSKGRDVRMLFLSGSQNPGAFPEDNIVNAVTDEQILHIGGISVNEGDSLNKKFVQTFLPILKNDLEVCKHFKCDYHKLNIDSVICYGEDDIYTKIEEIRGWKNFVNVVSIEKFSGEHLFVNDDSNIERIIRMLNKYIEFS